MVIDRISEYRQLEFIAADPVPEWFGPWFSGFVDGEGCFMIGKKFSCTLSIMLREDDRAVLELIRNTLKIGHMSRRVKSKAEQERNHSHSHPCLTWTVSRTVHLCRYILPLLACYPLRSKKCRDYEIWKKAVKLRSSVSKRSSRPLWYMKEMDRLRNKLQEVRRFS